MSSSSKSPKIVPSRFRTPFTVQKYIARPTDMGGQEGEWVDAGFLVYGDISYGGGSEQINAQRVQSRCMATILARWDPRLDATCRLFNPNGHMFNVRDVHNVEDRNVYMNISVEEGVAA